MPKPKKHQCTGHIIRFCPEIKELIKAKKDEMIDEAVDKADPESRQMYRDKKGVYRIKTSIRFEDIVNTIIVEWEELRRQSKQ